MPLTAPSAEAAMEFLTWLIPPSVLSDGSSRIRRRGDLRPEGRRSDQGYIVLSRAEPSGRVRQVALKSQRSIRSYLADQIGAPLADHWAAVQSSQYRSGRDGQVNGGFTTETTRHLLGITIDLDGSRMDPLYRELLERNWYAFREFVDELLALIGVERYLLVRSGPEGCHLHIPLARPDGKPLRASEKNREVWTQASIGLHRHFSQFGADPIAGGKPVQPFVIPGIPRAKHDGFIPYVGAIQDGETTSLYTLLRSLAARNLLVSRRAVIAPSPAPERATGDLSAALEDIADRAAGVPSGGRNDTAFRVAAYLLSRGASEAQTWEALDTWNRRNDPPMPQRELRGRLTSALRARDRNPARWAAIMTAPWNGLRLLLGLPAVTVAGYRQNGRWRPLTPAKTWTERKATPGGREHFEEIEERLLRLVASEGGQVALTAAAICDMIDTNRSSLKVVLSRLQASGALQVSAKRGRGGLTTLTILTVDLNGQSGSLTGGAKAGERVGQIVLVAAWSSTGSVVSNPSEGCLGAPGAGESPDFETLSLGPADCRRVFRLIRGGRYPSSRDGP